MKRITFVVLVIVGMVIAGTIIAGLGGSMRTPITQPGFDNIPTMIAFDPTETTVINTAAVTTLYEIEIPRNSLGQTDRAIKLELEYVLINNTGVQRGMEVKVYYGTSAFAGFSEVRPTSADPQAGKFTVYLINDAAVDAQNVYIRDDYSSGYVNVAAWTQDSNKALDLKITVELSVASALLHITRYYVTVTQFAP